MNFATTMQDDTTVIRVPARFDFRVARDFDTMADAATRGPGGEIVIDLAGTQYLDSAGLGMLLVLRDRARSAGKSVVLARAGATVKQVLEIAKFKQIFEIR